MSAAAGDHRHAVLLVEDDYETREAFTMLATTVGLDVVAVENGRVALRRLRDGGFRPCLIVLDIAMPEMDGLEFRRQQLADPALAELSVAVVTGGGWAVEADARKLGLTVFLRKPVEPDQLLRAFTDHCGAQAG
jgi:two-component system, chemotaxis family, chemotaxis protein CheY